MILNVFLVLRLQEHDLCCLLIITLRDYPMVASKEKITTR